ncbi:MAG: hypothetical protein H0X47_03655 [Nitrospirales bacterium]|nr:hypothetical protein [Nitrospirales bacterium]
MPRDAGTVPALLESGPSPYTTVVTGSLPRKKQVAMAEESNPYGRN